MKRVVNGVLYDTAKSELLAVVGYGRPGDLDYWSEELYITKNGRYFLYAEGGPMTVYRVRVADNEYTGGWAITPMTKKEALAWMEARMEGENYLPLFSDIVEEG